MTGYWKTTTLPDRLRALAEELESAERYGLHLPGSVIVHGGVTFYLSDPADFNAWTDYLEVDPHASGGFRCAEGNTNGLPVHVFTRPAVQAVS